MLDIKVSDITIVYPLGTCDEYSKSIIQHYIDNTSCKILIIYRTGKPEDYIIHPRVKYSKNIVEQNYPKVFNQCIKETETEYVAVGNWKYLCTEEDLKFGIEKLKLGYGIIDFAPCFFIHLFSKHLISVIGFWDEWLIHNVEHEWDLICRLKYYDVAMYQEKIAKMISRRTIFNPGGDTKKEQEMFLNFQKWRIKWKQTSNGYDQVFHEKNYKDRKLYKDSFQSRVYLKFKDSHIIDKLAVERCLLKNSGISLNYLVDDYDWDENEKKILETEREIIRI